jgi:hypothetical protein
MLPKCALAKRGADYYFKIEHSDDDVIQKWSMVHDIAKKTKAEVQSSTSEDDFQASKDFEVFYMLFRGIELTFAAPPRKVRRNAIVSNTILSLIFFFS